ncbi:hypothetical protein [Candidatus Methylomirabilis sp.]|uniref:hypothetical protein n=1 Tax=Candidatus Methylomirabilis sp. TaxID=2032687 RepID=UPI003C70FF82
MKQTRTIGISDRVFTSQDLARIATIFQNQADVSGGEQGRCAYEVGYDDRTTVESDTAEVFSEESLNAPARPIAIRMSFRDYSRGRNLSLSLDHGDSAYRNAAVVSGSEPAWLAETFLALKEALDRTKPQEHWLRRHPTLLLNLIALGIGSLGVLLIDLVLTLFFNGLHLERVISPLPVTSPWRQVFAEATPALYVAGWFWRWLCGYMWGAFAVRRWLLATWPTIEFDFGLAHLHEEKQRRRRLNAVGALVVLPIVTTFVYDLMKGAF